MIEANYRFSASMTFFHPLLMNFEGWIWFILSLQKQLNEAI